VPYLFDTNAISEIFRPRPNRAYLQWVRGVTPEEHFTSIVVIAELYGAAFRASNSRRWHERIARDILPNVIVLPLDLVCARETGRLHAELARRGEPIGTADVQIAATALVHGLTVVTANRRHFERIPDLPLQVFTPGETG
jgi:predicted nucleic acid-binding protein